MNDVPADPAMPIDQFPPVKAKSVEYFVRGFPAIEILLRHLVNVPLTAGAPRDATVI